MTNRQVMSVLLMLVLGACDEHAPEVPPPTEPPAFETPSTDAAPLETDAGQTLAAQLASLTAECHQARDAIADVQARVDRNVEFLVVDVGLYESGAEVCAEHDLPCIAMTSSVTYSIDAANAFLGFTVPTCAARVMPRRCAPGLDYAFVPDGSFARSRHSEAPSASADAFCLSEPLYRSALCARIPSYSHPPILRHQAPRLP